MKPTKAIDNEADVPPEFSKPTDETPPLAFSSLVSVDIFAMTDKGHVRTRNEDHFIVVRCGRAVETVLSNIGDNEAGDLFEEMGWGMVVADGVGGEAAGEVA